MKIKIKEILNVKIEYIVRYSGNKINIDAVFNSPQDANKFINELNIPEHDKLYNVWVDQRVTKLG